MRNRLKYKLIAPIIALLLLIVGNTVAVSAADPSIPTTLAVNSCKIFRNLSEEGDWLVVYEYNILFANNQWPSATTDVNTTFLFRMMSGTHDLGYSKPYPYYQYVSGVSGFGYGTGVGAFYFTAQQVSDLGLEWGGSYTIRIDTNPNYFTGSNTYVTYNISSQSYSGEESQAKEQEELETYIVNTLAPSLTSQWGVILVTDGALNQVGQSYFQNTIKGLQSMAPGLYSINIVSPSKNPKVGMDLANEWNHRWDGTVFEEKILLKLENIFNTSWRLVTTFIFLLVWAFMEAISQIKWGNTDPGFYSGCILFGIMATLSLFDVAAAAVMAFCLIFYVGYIFFGRTN